MAQTRCDPSFRNLDGHFDLGFVLGFPWPGGHDRRAVVFGHVGIGPVDSRFVETGFGHAGLQIVADHLCGRAAKVACCRFRGHEDKIVTKELECGYDETEV